MAAKMSDVSQCEFIEMCVVQDSGDGMFNRVALKEERKEGWKGGREGGKIERGRE
jgi:hypothetical protein